MKNILVTGGSGFIGTHVVNRLKVLGFSPIIFDVDMGRVLVPDYCATVLNQGAIEDAISATDGVIHLAGTLGTAETIGVPAKLVTDNILGSLNVFSACRKFDKPCVYITVGNYWMYNAYSITKSTAERFAWMFNREHGTRISVVRAYNAYGPGQKAAPIRKIIPNFINPALNNIPITIYGDGKQIMDMIYVEDLADILIRALTVDHGCYVTEPQQDSPSGMEFEAGSGKRTTVNYIAKTIMKMVGGGTIEHLPMRPGEPPRAVVVGDPKTLKVLYGGKLPKLTSLADGLAKTIDYYRGIRDEED